MLQNLIKKFLKKLKNVLTTLQKSTIIDLVEEERTSTNKFLLIF